MPSTGFSMGVVSIHPREINTEKLEIIEQLIMTTNMAVYIDETNTDFSQHSKENEDLMCAATIIIGEGDLGSIIIK